MALPVDGSRDESERTDDVGSYRVTCMDFIRDISADYLAWVDRYSLPAEEDARRRAEIASTIRRTSDWIARVAQTIRAVDVVMNDGIQKMAEATAGRPFQIGVFVNGASGYTAARPGVISVGVKAAGRDGRLTSLGFHFKRDRFRLESTARAFLDESALPGGAYGLMDAALRLDATACAPRDVISFTVTVNELDAQGQVLDKRGVSTLVHVT